VAADEALDGIDRILGVDNGLPLGGLADERSPFLLKATTDGHSRPPSAVVMTVGCRLP
jgi:hypothetical protein